MRIINLTHRGLFKHPSHPFTQKIDKDHKGYLIGSLIGAETGIKTIAAVHSQFRCWVKTGKARSEQMFSAVHPITDVAKVLRHVRSVPISEVPNATLKRRQKQRSGTILTLNPTDEERDVWRRAP